MSGLIGLIITIIVLHGAVGQGPICTITLPPNFLSAKGLATPFKTSGCTQTVTNQQVFAEATIVNPITGAIYIFNPVIADKNMNARIPILPTINPGDVVGLWFGSNAMGIKLKPSKAGELSFLTCVQGDGKTNFGQMAFCNAAAFFVAAKIAIKTGQLSIPPLGTSPKSGKPCYTVRSFEVVDQDQSDNVVTEYILANLAGGGTEIAQFSKANMQYYQAQQKAGKVTSFTTIMNGSDNRLVSVGLDNALGCKPFEARDQADVGAVRPSLALNELFASQHEGQYGTVALVPQSDPMVVDGNGNADLKKLNLYRAGVDQPLQPKLNPQSDVDYCSNMLTIGAASIKADKPFYIEAPTIDPAVGTNLWTFMGARFQASFVNLDCLALLDKTQEPVVAVTNADGVATVQDNQLIQHDHLDAPLTQLLA
ncbi:hypothetical protein SmJEL517_g01395 [Synchytrium microbalum]|uniref:Secreted protein n=1 Tax=Synchytrium microbalum TaxID=1806994 RepID=A0A507C677_9FUNG|nr:uncharacterized protein SmJEL517_g01395 [Synchytrium microbalum]TPX36537.1 hypothetical protein SmJEL517_g01395 [Synchytrium microbalum]